MPVIKLVGAYSWKAQRKEMAARRSTTCSTVSVHSRSAPSKALIVGLSRITSVRPVSCSTLPLLKSTNNSPACGFSSRLPRVLKCRLPA
ncbi:hypothetical protein D3C76_1646210 [compost metagenome]